ncbi:DNA helicase [Malassezia yamatoensis]|uniref:Transcription initiation factor IIF subunit beta n=1 Tax=Malassezia yamatoensis TaxID=253288 RepID=A0AAJ6CHQ2_9BASI|nr:DNA helicase [Malassezia yamatoensis]
MSNMDDVEDLGPEPPMEPSTSAARHTNPNRELSPEPDQDLNTARGAHQVWLVKVPKFLIDGWSQVYQDDVRLGTVRVHDPDQNGNQRMELLLPDAPQPAIPVSDASTPSIYGNVPRAYDMRLTSSTQDTYAKNLYAFQEELVNDEDANDEPDELDVEDMSATDFYRKRSMGSGPARIPNKKKRMTALAGTVTNETALQPKRNKAPDTKPEEVKPVTLGSRSLITPEYREIMRNRHKSSTTPKRSVKMMEETDAGLNNMLAAGVGKGHIKSRAANLVYQASQARSNQAPEKFARMPRNELLDLLFSLFDRYKHWSLKRLREETQQPYTYLREVLLSIADQHHNGPYAGSWSLKREYNEAMRNAGQSSQPSGPTNNTTAPEQLDDDQDLEDV